MERGHGETEPRRRGFNINIYSSIFSSSTNTLAPAYPWQGLGTFRPVQAKIICEFMNWNAMQMTMIAGSFVESQADVSDVGSRPDYSLTTLFNQNPIHCSVNASWSVFHSTITGYGKDQSQKPSSRARSIITARCLVPQPRFHSKPVHCTAIINSCLPANIAIGKKSSKHLRERRLRLNSLAVQHWNPADRFPLRR